MQFVSWTWNWVAEKYDLPMWDEWVIMRWGRPYTENKTHDIGFEQTEFNSLLTITYCLTITCRRYTAEHNGEIGAVVSGVGVMKRNGGLNGNQNNETCYED